MKTMLRLVLMLVGMGVLSAEAATFYMKSGLSGSVDWSDPKNYVDAAEPPQPGDTVVIASGSQVTARYGSPNFELVTQLALVVPMDEASLTVEVTAAADTAVLKCAVSTYQAEGASEFSGCLVKSGAGKLVLDSSSQFLASGICRDYYVELYVQNGTLAGSPDAAVSYSFRNVDVAEGAMFVSPSRVTSYYTGWTGKGTITNESAAVTGHVIQGGRHAVFEGVVAGENLRVNVNQEQDFTGIASTYGGGLYVGSKGTAGVLQLGYYPNSTGGCGLGYPGFSALGSMFEAPGVIRYLGYGEETEKEWLTTPNGSTIDAGVTGGLVFKGAFTIADDVFAQSLLYLTGSNKVECVLANDFNANANGYGYYLIKRGPGTYRFADKATRTFAGPIAIENGTIRYDSIAEAGKACSLGYATKLYSRKSSVSSDDVSQFAFVLGNANSTDAGYLVSAAAVTNTQRCSTRVFGIDGIGGFVSGSSRVSYAGVTSASAGMKTLVLDGDVKQNDLVSAVTNGYGKIGIEKRGRGTWLLESPFEFDGPLTVNGGELEIIHGGDRYDWYRLRLRETAFSCPKFSNDVEEKWIAQSAGAAPTDADRRRIALNEFALIDANGNRCVAYPLTHAADGVTIASQCTNAVAAFCQRGEFALGNADANATMLAGPHSIAGLFEVGGNKNLGDDNEDDYFEQVNPKAFGYDDEPSWVDVIFRVTNGTAAAAYCDLNYLYSYSSKLYGANPTAFVLEGSVDGVNWEELLSVKNIDQTSATAGRWISGNVDGANKLRWTNVTKCFSLTKTEPTKPGTKVIRSPVSVAPGAKLTVRGPVKLAGLKLRRDGMGEITGVSFAESGTLDVPELAETEASVTYHTSIRNLPGASFISDWIITKNGGNGANYSLTYDPETGDITIYRGGSAIIVR